MPYKICSYCEKASYSAANSPSVQWLCPHCGKDISHVEGQIALPPKEEQAQAKE